MKRTLRQLTGLARMRPERTLTGRVVSVDRAEGVAVVRVGGRELRAGYATAPAVGQTVSVVRTSPGLALIVQAYGVALPEDGDIVSI